MGILDNIIGSSIDDPKTAATLAMAQALLGPGRTMQRLTGGAQGYVGTMAAAREGEERQKERALRQAMVQAQIGQIKAQQEQQTQQAAEQQRLREAEAAFRARLVSPQMQASQAALSGEQGPTNAAAAQMPQVSQQDQLLWDAMNLGLIKPLDYVAATRKESGPIKLGAGETLYDPKTFKPLVANPKEDTTDPFVRLLKQSGIDPASPQGQALLLQRVQKEATHTPGTKVEVNTGQRGLDNTLKVRGDFRSEPVYKAFQEMQSAYAQIQQSLKQASPAGDLAGATKIMKLLDPGSVVRESELGMAMAASGLMDRVLNYANMVRTGQKLTPTQRKDFQTLADALYQESVKQYGAKRSEYEGLAQRHGLNTLDVLGPVPTTPSGVVIDWGNL